ncbi:6-aminohexanoate-dimer hydrolase [Candidatus Phycosocius bacilliformis]|uniref:6-aminohexanoate-dimer hydrolase n=2 Tax=Candidatus Phycosocius bacilliformis TaxID=1445552 RepID=A0A2P2EDV9_9PROT|nr:6-aminohexanoate-dimer hydrolase [Candidatus Phycosocius bacilliformis]
MLRRAMQTRRNPTIQSRKIWFGLALASSMALGLAGLVVAQDSRKVDMAAAAKAGLVPLPPQPAGVPFPTDTWPRGPLPSAASPVIQRQLDAAFLRTDGPMGETRAVIIVQGGRIVAERYGQGFDEKSKLVSWSMAKSVTASLVGIAVLDGKIKLDQPLNEPLWEDGDPRRAITIRQALHMTDGLRWREDGYEDPITNDAAKMLFGPGRENIVDYVASKPVEFAPGTHWRYSSGTTNLISAALSRAVAQRDLRDPTGAERYRNFMYERLFRPIGMNNVAVEFDLAGNFYASSLMHATAQDWARFGLLHLRDGVWDGKRILPEGYVDFLRTPTTAEGATAYGAHWWLSLPNQQGLLKKGPYDSFEAHGFQGQWIGVIPSKDLVIVRLGLMRSESGWEDLGAWVQPIVDAFPTKTAPTGSSNPG